VQHRHLDVADRHLVAVRELPARSALLAEVPDHPVVRVEVCRGPGRRDEVTDRGDVVVVGVGEEDGDDPPSADNVEDRARFVGRVDGQALGAVAEHPDVVLNVPGAAIEAERP